MGNPLVGFFNGERKLTRWLRIFRTNTKQSKPSVGKQGIGFLLLGMGAACVALVLGTLLVVLIAPNLPASRSSLAQSEGAAQLATTALQDFLPGNDVRIERLFAYNLKLYVDRKSFEDIPYPDRKAMIAKIGQLWCDNIGYHWLARVSIVDISSGNRLSTHACAFGKLRALF